MGEEMRIKIWRCVINKKKFHLYKNRRQGKMVDCVAGNDGGANGREEGRVQEMNTKEVLDKVNGRTDGRCDGKGRR